MRLITLRLALLITILCIQGDLNATCHTQIDSSTNLLIGIELMDQRQFDSSLYHLGLAEKEYTKCNNYNELLSTLTTILDCNLKSFKFEEIDLILNRTDSILDQNKLPLDLRYNYILLKSRYYWYITEYDKANNFLVKYETYIDSINCEDIPNNRFLYFKGCTLLSMERLERAIKIFRSLIKNLEGQEIVDSVLLTKSLSKIGVSYFYLDNIEEAIKYNDKSIEIKSKFKSKKSLISSLINSSAYNFARINYDKAEIDLINAKKLVTKYFGKSHPNLANIYNQLGAIRMRNNDFHRSILCFKKAENLINAYPSLKHYDLSVIYYNLSSLYTHLGNKKKSLEYFNLYSKISTKSIRNKEIKVLKQLELLNSYKNNGKYTLIVDSLASIQIKDNCILANINHELGIYFLYKNNNKSIFYFKNEFALLKKCKYEINIRFSKLHYSLSDYYLHLDSLNLAANQIDSALTYITKNGSCPRLIDSYTFPYLAADGLFQKIQVQAKLFEKNKDFKHLFSAFDNILIVKEIYDSYRKSYQSDNSKLILAEETYNLFREAIPISYKLYEHTNDFKFLEAILLFSESNKSMIVLEAVNDLHAKKFSNIPDSLVEKERLIRVDIAYYNEKLFYELEKKEQDQDSALISQTYDKIYQLTEQKEQANRFFQSNFPNYSDLKNGLEVPKINFIKTQLNDDMALIEYFVTDNKLFIMLFTDNKFTLEKIDYQFNLPSKVNNFKKSITKNDFAAYDSLSFQLYQFLIEPIACRIKDKRLIIIPDGQLNYIPFELLTTEKRNKDYENYYESKYFFSDHPITYNYSAALYFKGKQKKFKKRAAKNFLGFAPTFGFKFDDQFEDALPDGSYKPKRFIELPWAIREVESISNILSGNIFLKQNATKEKFLEVAHNYNVLHLATHAFTHDRFPDYSGLVFASPDSTITFKNYLHTNELYNLSLNADITVLSACETGVGAEQYGEGLMCLSRGLAYAGCPSMIASKWQLSDQSTARLMGYFYKYVNKGVEKDIALQKARTEFMENMHHFIIPPRFWGALTIIGNEEKIDINSTYETLKASLLRFSNFELSCVSKFNSLKKVA